MVFGKIIAGLLGLMIGGPIGALVGVFIGHTFDRGLGKALSFASPENLARLQASFFETTFLLSGYLAKVDGHISESEVAHAEQLIAQLGLNAEQRERAIAFFRQGSQADFQIEPTVQAFIESGGAQPQLKQTLLLFLISQAHADDDLAAVEKDALQRIAEALGLLPAHLDRLLKMAQAQRQFHGSGSAGGPSSAARIEDAYTALGVDSSIGDKELKKAYRKLMSEHHPDKLIAKGVPEDMIRLATERAQEIQSAYEMIRKQRGLSRK
jgi:DnaJ like chaperone protein